MDKETEGTDNKRRMLELIAGLDVAPKTEPKAKRSAPGPDGLTDKQRRFCEEIIAGQSLADAYRAAYDCSGMTDKSVREKASFERSKVNIESALLRMADKKEAQNRMKAASRSDQIWEALMPLALGHAADVSPSVQVAALGLASKLAGMQRDSIEIKQERNSSEIEQELAALVGSLKSRA